MTHTKDEALKLALEALEYWFESFELDRDGKAIIAIKQALALDKKAENARELGLDYEPVQEPQVFGPPIGVLMKMEGDETRKLYPLKQKPAPTVQEPVAWMYEDMMGLVGVRVQKEKPIVARPVTPLCLCTPPAQPAPVACEWCYGRGVLAGYAQDGSFDGEDCPHCAPTAAKRQWVGLTDEERTEIRREHYARTSPLMDAIEAKLKEKNT